MISEPGRRAYPPEIAAEVEIAQSEDGPTPSFVVGSYQVGRYLRLGVLEHRVLQLLNGTVSSSGICSEMERRHGVILQPSTVIRFLGKLDGAGILAGSRTRAGVADVFAIRFYLRCSLFNPDRLFGRVLPGLRWIWTSGFLTFSLLIMTVSAAVALMKWPQVAAYGSHVLQQHYALVLVLTWIVVTSHEFAHGLTAKAFGGRATELGALLIYYCLPALYCNVSGLYLIPERRRRLWVIAAGLYWQVFVGACSLLAWFVLAPYTWQADLAMAFVLACVLNIVFNANPLLKLDGYYFLSQWLRVPNLVERSQAYWRGKLLRLVGGNVETTQIPWREQRVLLFFGLASFLYRLVVAPTLFFYGTVYLTSKLGLIGLLLSVLLALIALYALLWERIAAIIEALREAAKVEKGDAKMGDNESQADRSGKAKWPLVAISAGVLLTVVLCIPWTASVGSYGILLTRPDHEATVRAPEDGSLSALNVRPGEQVRRGLVLGHLVNLDLDEQIAGVQAELARSDADSRRLIGELQVRQQEGMSAALQSNRKRQEFNEVEAEEQQIERRFRSGGEAKQILFPSAGTLDPGVQFRAQDQKAALPAALAAIEARAGVRRAKLDEAVSRLERDRLLYAEGILPRTELEQAESAATSLRSDLADMGEQFNTALVNHRRQRRVAKTDFDLSESSIALVNDQVVQLSSQLKASSNIIQSLRERLNVLEEKRQNFLLKAPVSGTVFGEELPRITGRYLEKGAEICRIADVSELLVRIQVSEREIGDVQVGEHVRVKSKAFPSLVFRGRVSRIASESDLDQNRQATYRVELTITNDGELLRSGMTVFARVDFGRHLVGWILAHKLRQVLQPETWML